MKIKDSKKCLFKTLMLTLLITISLILLAHDRKTSQTLKIGFTGDVMLGRLVNKQISKKDYAYPWGNLLDLLHSTDLNIINLETTLTTSNKKVPKVFNFKADPDKVETLKLGRIDVVNIANNHILDFSEEGMFETIEVLDKANIEHVGAGKNEEEARKPVIIEKNGIKVGIIGYTDNEPGWLAAQNKPGTNYITVSDIAKVKEDVNKIREKVDILILTIHWGPNMRQFPTQEFIDFAHQVIDAGVDIFHGHSAHIFQPVEIYKNRVILYDTGDFVDDYAVDPLLKNNESFFYIVDVGKTKINNVTLVPVFISNMQVNLAKNSDAESIINKMINMSKQFETKFSIENSKITYNFP